MRNRSWERDRSRQMVSWKAELAPAAAGLRGEPSLVEVRDAVQKHRWNRDCWSDVSRARLAGPGADDGNVVWPGGGRKLTTIRRRRGRHRPEPLAAGRADRGHGRERRIRD